MVEQSMRPPRAYSRHRRNGIKPCIRLPRKLHSLSSDASLVGRGSASLAGFFPVVAPRLLVRPLPAFCGFGSALDRR